MKQGHADIVRLLIKCSADDKTTNMVSCSNARLVLIRTGSIVVVLSARYFHKSVTWPIIVMTVWDSTVVVFHCLPFHAWSTGRSFNLKRSQIFLCMKILVEVALVLTSLCCSMLTRSRCKDPTVLLNNDYVIQEKKLNTNKTLILIVVHCLVEQWWRRWLSTLIFLSTVWSNSGGGDDSLL